MIFCIMIAAFWMILQILGVPEQAEKDEIVKAAMELKSSEIEEGYTADVIVSRQVSEFVLFLLVIHCPF